MKDYKKIIEEKDRQLLKLEIIIGYLSIITFFTTIFVASFVSMPVLPRATLIIVGLAVFFIGMFSCIKIEQTAGYYQCGKCNHRHVPTYLSVLFAPHFGRTRYMKCPKCNKKSWQHKVIGE